MDDKFLHNTVKDTAKFIINKRTDSNKTDVKMCFTITKGQK